MPDGLTKIVLLFYQTKQRNLTANDFEREHLFIYICQSVIYICQSVVRGRRDWSEWSAYAALQEKFSGRYYWRLKVTLDTIFPLVLVRGRAEYIIVIKTTNKK